MTRAIAASRETGTHYLDGTAVMVVVVACADDA